LHCSRTLNVCTYLVGGFERLGRKNLVCSSCRDVFLPPGWNCDLSPSMRRHRVYTEPDLQPAIRCA
jgi:hypothetical protein